MSKIINCEWLDKQPDFHKEVKLEDGTVFAKIHALTRVDRAVILKNSDHGKDLVSYSLWAIYQSLVGHDSEWYLDRELTFENVDSLPEKFFNPLRDAVLSFVEQNTVTEGQEKN